MALLDFAYVSAIFTAIVTVPFFFIAWFSTNSGPKRRRILSIVALLFPISIIVGWLVALISTSMAQFHARQFLDSASEKCVVTINGKGAENSSQILNALKTISDLPAHHSSPTRTLDVQLVDPPRHLWLWVARDSSNPHEYWLFAPSPSKLALRAALKKDIGHVITSVFDTY